MEQENDITVATPTPTAASLPVHSLSTYERTRRQSLDEWFKMRENCAQQYGRVAAASWARSLRDDVSLFRKVVVCPKYLVVIYETAGPI